MSYIFFFLLSVVGISLAQAQNADAGLLAWYRLDNSAADSGPHQNNGTIEGTTQAAADRFGNPCGAMHFDGKSAFLMVPSSPSLQMPTTSFSVTVWFRLDKDSNGLRNVVILSKGAAQVHYKAMFFQRFQEGTSQIALSNQIAAPDKNYEQHILETEKWYFLALTYGDGWAYAYLNGQVIWQAPFMGELTVNNAPLEIGRCLSAAVPYFAGSLDDLKIYDLALPYYKIVAQYKDETNREPETYFQLRMPRNIEVNTEKGQCYAAVHFAMPRVEVNCGNYELKQLSGERSGAHFAPGNNVIVYEATAGGKSISDSFSVIVRDREAPYLQCPANITVSSADGNPVKVTYPEIVASDNCPNVQLNANNSKVSGSNFPIGVTPVNYTATDASGNKSTCSFLITVNNTNPPSKPGNNGTAKGKSAKPGKEQSPGSDVVIIDLAPKEKPQPEPPDNTLCQTDIFKNNDPGKCGALVSYSLPILQKSAHAKTLQIAGLPSGSFFRTGNTTNTFVSADMNGAKKECFFTVHVKDVEPPAIICPDDSFILLNPGRRGIIFHYQRPTATDNCAVDSVVQTEGSASGCFLSVGQHRFAFEAHDRWGNTRQCSFTVTVQSAPETNIGIAPTFIDEQLNMGGDTITYEHKVETSNCLLTVYMYDDGEEDNDTVSIIYNNQLIVNHEMIRNKENGAIKRFITLTSGQENYLIAKAWNTGKYGLNTLRIDIYEGYIENDKKDLRGKKPVLSKVLHSKPGTASGVLLKCKW